VASARHPRGVQLYLDCDGVLADFDRGAERVLGLRPREFERRFGLGKFWAKIARTPGFFEHLPEMPDARQLFDAVAHLDPIILTGCPRGGWAEGQKEAWAAKHFPGTPIITCMAVNKKSHCTPGDILVDDTLKHCHLWEAVGGTFVHHKSARRTIEELRRDFPELFPDQRPARRTTREGQQPSAG
jgi:hypothetical protein